jgi:hypothetical protein|tara:strand:+ start:495 stop:791 length:297 start_codon:yes stop_codon:yes gene_type:complete
MAHKVKDFNLDGTYVERDATADEVKALQDRIDNKFNVMISDFRLHRNSLLRKTDWTSGSDVTMSAEMKEYRQKLRDAPSGLDTVEKIEAYEFPTEVTK